MPRSAPPFESIALAASTAAHVLALVALGLAIQPWPVVRAAPPAAAWIQTELQAIEAPPRVEEIAQDEVAHVETAPARYRRAPGLPRRRTRTLPRHDSVPDATAASSSDVIVEHAPADIEPLTTIEAGPESVAVAAASPPGDPDGDPHGGDEDGGGEARAVVAAAASEPAPEPARDRCGDPIEGMWHGFALHTLENYRHEFGDVEAARESHHPWHWFHADVFLWIRRVDGLLQGAAMIHEWSSTTRRVTAPPCGPIDFDHTSWMWMVGSWRDPSLQMANAASEENVERAGGCGEHRFVEWDTREVRSGGHDRFDVQRVGPDELTGLYRWGFGESVLHLTRQACIADVQWPRW